MLLLAVLVRLLGRRLPRGEQLLLAVNARLLQKDQARLLRRILPGAKLATLVRLLKNVPVRLLNNDHARLLRGRRNRHELFLLAAVVRPLHNHYARLRVKWLGRDKLFLLAVMARLLYQDHARLRGGRQPELLLLCPKCRR
jgi:hypothetical protein